MPKPFPLQILLDLARTESDTATARLGTLNRHDRDMAQRLRLLLEYRREYNARLVRMTAGGVNSVDWCNCLEFIGKIDAAIAQQRETLAESKHQLHTGRNQWQEQRRKLKSLDTLSERHRALGLKHESKSEQKEQDEYALKGFLGGRVLMG